MTSSGASAGGWEALRAAALDELSTPVAILDAQARVLGSNRAWGALARGQGWPALAAGTSFEAHCLQVWDQPAADALTRGMRAVLSGAARSVEVECRPSPVTLDPRRLQVRIAALEVGGVGSLLVSAEDVTAAREAQEALRQARRLSTWGQLAGGVAHDFNNVLTGIMGYCELALANLQVDAPGRQEVEQIQRAGNQAMGLVRQLLRFGRRKTPEPRPVDLGEALEAVTPLLDHLLGERVRLTARARPERGLVVVIDPVQLEQVIMNLALNARDSMPDGGQLWIEVAPTRSPAHEPQVELAVRDTGVGIPPDVLPRVFEPLFTTKGNESSLGLGLATVREVVSQNGGQVAVESEPGRGTTFRITLPRAGESEAPPPAMLPG